MTRRTAFLSSSRMLCTLLRIRVGYGEVRTKASVLSTAWVLTAGMPHVGCFPSLDYKPSDGVVLHQCHTIYQRHD